MSINALLGSYEGETIRPMPSSPAACAGLAEDFRRLATGFVDDAGPAVGLCAGRLAEMFS